MLELLITLLMGQTGQQLQGDYLEANEQPEIHFNYTIPIDRPYTESAANLVYDQTTNTILHKENLNKRLPIASLTKLMTALIILEEHQIDEVVTIPATATQVIPVKAGLRNNEQITVEYLMHALLIHSANDAAVSLAIHNAESEAAFVTKMNQRAQTLGLNNTNFQNASGFDHPDNYSTAHDLLKLIIKLLEQPLVKEITSKQSFTITNTTNTIKHDLVSTNQLIDSGYVIGLKTGTTPAAGQCFVGLTAGPKQLITITLNSPNRFQETKLLIDWALNNYN